MISLYTCANIAGPKLDTSQSRADVLVERGGGVDGQGPEGGQKITEVIKCIN